MIAKKLYYKECHLAGRQYHDADEVWEELHVGTLLELRREPDNRYDKNAVAVMYSDGSVDEDNEPIEYHLGYIPAAQNRTIAALLDMGWNDIFECHISQINPHVHYEEQIRMSIRIKKNEAAK